MTNELKTIADSKAIDDLKAFIQSTKFTMYSSFGQAEYSTLLEPRKGVKLSGDPLSIDEDGPKDFGNKTKTHKSIGKRPSVLESQPKMEYYRKRHILRKGQQDSKSELASINEEKGTDTPDSPFPQ